MDGVSHRPKIVIDHPAADPSHPDHENFLERLRDTVVEFGLAIAVDAVTHGVVHIGPLADGKSKK